MKLRTIFIGICTFCGLLWLFGPTGDAGWRTIFNAIMGVLFVIAVIWTLIDLWGSNRTSDSKLYWTVLGLFFAPFAVPVYWYLRTFPFNPLAQPDGDGNAGKPPCENREP